MVIVVIVSICIVTIMTITIIVVNMSSALQETGSVMGEEKQGKLLVEASHLIRRCTIASCLAVPFLLAREYMFQFTRQTHLCTQESACIQQLSVCMCMYLYIHANICYIRNTSVRLLKHICIYMRMHGHGFADGLGLEATSQGFGHQPASTTWRLGATAKKGQKTGLLLRNLV